MIILPKNDYFAQKKLSGCRAHFPGTFVTLKHWTAIAKLQKHQNAFENHVFFSIFQQENRARKVGKNPMKNWFLIGSCHLSFKLNLVSLWLHKISEQSGSYLCWLENNDSCRKFIKLNSNNTIQLFSLIIFQINFLHFSNFILESQKLIFELWTM